MFEGLQNIFKAADWVELILVFLDILIVFYIIYRILLLIKGTRAVQMLIGLLAIIIGFFASKQEFLNLPTLNWLLDTFLSFFFLIIIVIFQDDIRRVLSQMGQTSLFSGLSTGMAETQIIEEIVKASVQLSDSRTGAIIAIQREAELSKYAGSGTILNARLTKELLASVFVAEKGNPLHDGAVLIQGDRVLAAGCILNLTDADLKEKSLGTRHRAAIGLSQETDAAIVVVSEETGTISVAFKSDLVRGLDATELRELLQRIFSHKASEEGKDSRRLSLSWLRGKSQQPSVAPVPQEEGSET